ncbi:MAG: D-alanine--D-alanine ligase [Coriobacteriales bacterium]|jgi:D-alanine-D-alanine ligase|nr:D-alanine--D-alanine ligase [Coriobacteriales bacterium]
MPYKVAVLMGGSSFERDFSLASGKYVLRTLEAGGHTVLPLDTTTSLVDSLRREQPDVAFIALHGGHGEDGTVQALLEYLAIPFVGSSSGVCRTAWNKSMLPVVLKSHRQGLGGAGAGARTLGPTHWPRGVLLSTAAFKEYGAAAALDLIAERLPSGYPYAVLPASGGSALGVNRVASFEELAPALLDALSFDDEVLVEEWVSGVELAVSVIGSGQAARALPPIEICSRGGFFNTEVRLDPDLVEYYAPVRSSSLLGTQASAQTGAGDEKENAADAARILALIEDSALEVHRSYGCRDLSRVDMFWDGAANRVKVLEINTSPGMAEHSLLPMAAAAANIPFGQLLNELLDMACARA